MWYNSMYLCELHHRLKYSSIRFGVLYSLSRCPIRLVFIFTPSRRLQLLLPLQIISNLIDWVSHYAFLIFLCRFKKNIIYLFHHTRISCQSIKYMQVLSRYILTGTSELLHFIKTCQKIKDLSVTVLLFKFTHLFQNFDIHVYIIL